MWSCWKSRNTHVISATPPPRCAKPWQAWPDSPPNTKLVCVHIATLHYGWVLQCIGPLHTLPRCCDDHNSPFHISTSPALSHSPTITGSVHRSSRPARPWRVRHWNTSLYVESIRIFSTVLHSGIPHSRLNPSESSWLLWLCFVMHNRKIPCSIHQSNVLSPHQSHAPFPWPS